jgi:DNA topoisomerase I
VRHRNGKFAYRGADGRAVDAEAMRRIAALRIPPAWAEVAINPWPRGRVQAVGRDAAGRWQYRYHASHVARQSRAKFERLVAFVSVLPALRKRIGTALGRKDLSEERVLCGILRILLTCFLRPGSGVYAQENGSFGIVTLRRQHVSVRGDRISFDFPGKSGKRQERVLVDRAVARLIRDLLRLPGRHVFKFQEPDRIVSVRRRRLNAYIKDVMGQRFSAKDFRTWAGTVLCAGALIRLADGPRSGRSGRRGDHVVVREAIRETAAQLGNTPAVCRASYIAPPLIGSRRKRRELEARMARGGGQCSLQRFERILVAVLRNGGSGQRSGAVVRKSA